jgi:hypothetical protein
MWTVALSEGRCSVQNDQLRLIADIVQLHRRARGSFSLFRASDVESA